MKAMSGEPGGAGTMRMTVLSILAVALVACNNSPGPAASASEPAVDKPALVESGVVKSGVSRAEAPGPETGSLHTICSSPRPEMCTMDYRPVCALLKSGSWQQFSNGCSACADPRVVGYNPDICPG